MHSPETSSSTTGPWNISDVASGFGSTKLATVIIRAALALAVLAALLLIAPLPAQAQTETVLYNFCSQDFCSDGYVPYSYLTFDGAGNLYGTTSLGGAWSLGTVFELSPNGSGGWNETVLYSFTGGADGSELTYGVTFDNAGNLYGTTTGGGANGCGVVFELSPVGQGWTETVLYSFTGGADGCHPQSGVIMDPAGNLYGTSGPSGGTPGTVFELSPSGGGWTEQGIYDQDAFGLTMDAAGNIYCVASWWIFELSPNGNGWNSTVIHTFPGAPKDGDWPSGTLVLDKAGNLYGTTRSGGARNLGTVYKLTPGKTGWTEEILHSFTGGKKDGVHPTAGVVLDAAGNIYGAMLIGGNYYNGAVFELMPQLGKGGYKEKVLWRFNGTDGDLPYESLILDSTGNLYGTTAHGGTRGYGVVFKLTPVAVTTTALTSSPNPSTYGQAVTFTAVVTSIAGAPPDGETITFEHGTAVLGTGSLSAGSATFTTSALPVGMTAVKAFYAGDSNFAGSKSNPVKQLVKKAPK